MTLLRAVPRAMLASYFVASGIKAIRDPKSLLPAAEPLADRVVPLVKQYSPDQVASVVPEDTVTLVRVFGAAQVLGGAALATGTGPHPFPEKCELARWRADRFGRYRRKAELGLAGSEGRGGACQGNPQSLQKADQEPWQDRRRSRRPRGSRRGHRYGARRGPLRILAKAAEAGSTAAEGGEDGGCLACRRGPGGGSKDSQEGQERSEEAGQGRRQAGEEDRRER